MINKTELKKSIERILKVEFMSTIKTACIEEKYYAVSKGIIEQIIDNWQKSTESYRRQKQAFYLSAEFLMGRAFGNNLINLGIYDDVRSVLDEIQIDINEIEAAEEDAGLGNGGLGRLAACFLDSCATLNLPVTGYGILYKYGIFKQKFIEGFQVEEGDSWLKDGYPWAVKKAKESVIIEFSNERVKAVPFDIPIIGHATKNINTLRLWQAEPIRAFDFQLFNDQKYNEAVEEKNKAEDISKVLYPNDSDDRGKTLRLKQQYFFVAASIKDIIKNYKMRCYKSFDDFNLYNAIQLNDTHPVVAIPELMRILVDDEKMEWQKAWEITRNTFSYTNHTILSEALEQWDCQLFKGLIPRVYEVIIKIDTQLASELKIKGYSDDKIQGMRIIEDGKIRMASLAIYGSHTTNGVAALHTDILKEKELKDWYQLYPERFQNKTNGITPRRWLALCNKELAEMITELLKSDQWIRDLSMLKELDKYSEDESVLKRFICIKNQKKQQLAEYIKAYENIEINIDSIFDIQIKRLHEYKRQLLNAFQILDLYYKLKENPHMEVPARTFIFGAKAAPGYFRAKGIIKYINEIARLINNDKSINEKIKVVFIQNYRVSYAERLFPAADVSIQISTAGKEASGTGNMKFMLNGTPTVGTYDGANVEIVEEAGDENNFIFGARMEEIEAIKDNYNPKDYYNKEPRIKRVVDTLIDGTFDDGGTGMFKELHNALLEGASWHKADNYFILRDFMEYTKVQEKVDEAYNNRLEWAKKCWKNLVNSGKFSTDRTISQYAEEIWNIKHTPILIESEERRVKSEE
ncbi:glycogen/starch/alpha-glucan phosphorylase [Alkaliphilus peptidifermentans]|uniref:Alpha-1,4 glucan phosphorylase n=1 Tax=Alkaliphilus peptidifermentans DSM 18978 TaxID=1120976 RepID=A0A1G5J356_9FIRM|nr:glycogen/starch/alpha-glucan phosphorylase [Alkaliphilus peptidifermentans]SCY82687.1 maltodextrin phosphorylase [Alkaliphilus peptidifermentans DSM 18978]